MIIETSQDTIKIEHSNQIKSISIRSSGCGFGKLN